MDIVVYKNNSKRLVADKELTTLDTLTGTFIQTTDSLRPRFRVKLSDETTGCDYCYIAEMSRYYYVTGRQYVLKDMVELELEVDLRMTYKEALREKKGIVCRQRDNYDMYLADGSIPSSIKRNTSIYQFGSTPFSSDGYGLNVMIVLGGR